jgi:hypothetical protein
MSRILLVAFVCFCCRYPVLSQTVTLQEVEFSGNGYIGIRDDSILSVYTPPQWSASGSKPVAIASGNALSAGATFTASGPLPATILVRAVSTDNYEFPVVSVSTSNPNQIVYPVSQALTQLPYHRVKYYNSFLITWSVSFDNGGTWQTAGTSDNKLYVTYQDPIPEINFADQYQHSLIEISCRNANHDSTESDHC